MRRHHRSQVAGGTDQNLSLPRHGILRDDMCPLLILDRVIEAIRVQDAPVPSADWPAVGRGHRTQIRAVCVHQPSGPFARLTAAEEGHQRTIRVPDGDVVVIVDTDRRVTRHSPGHAARRGVPEHSPFGEPEVPAPGVLRVPPTPAGRHLDQTMIPKRFWKFG